MKNLFSVKLWRRLSVLMVTLLVLFVALVDVGFANVTEISNRIGGETTKIIGESDATYYDLTYENSEAGLAQAKVYCNEVNEETEAEGLVLLTNEGNALPIEAGSSVSMFLSGSVKNKFATHGPGNMSQDCTYLADALTAAGFSVNQTLIDFYKTGAAKDYNWEQRYNAATLTQVYRINEAPWSLYDNAVKTSFNSYNDVALVVITRTSGEGIDLSASNSDGQDGSYLSLSAEEVSVIEGISAMSVFDKIVVLINSAATIQLDFLQNANMDIDACMWIGLPGARGMNSVAKALKGEVNPSGRLSDAWLYDNFSSPAGADWALTSKGTLTKSFSQEYTNADEVGLNNTQSYYGVYVEGIYVGYRYFETRYEDYVMGTAYTDYESATVGVSQYYEDVAFPFGYGLSYSTFSYSEFTVTPNATDKTYTVSVKVTNTGTVAGKEVVQIYLQKPYTDYDMRNNVEKASVELVGFAKTAELAANGGTEIVSIVIDEEQFKSYDSYGVQTYIVDAGKYYLTAAKNSHDAANNILAKKGYTVAAYNNVASYDAGNANLAEMVWDNPALDYTTYSVSTETGVDVYNQLDDYDINLYENAGTNSVTYVSRSNWEGTWPKAAVSLSVATEEMEYDLSSHKTIDDTGYTMPTFGAEGELTLITMRGKSYDDADWDKLLDQISYEEMSKMLTGCIGITPAIPSIAKPETNESDGPYGITDCKANTSFPCEGIIAATFNTELFAKVGDAIAKSGLAQGINGLYAPGLNTHRVAFGGRCAEYFSEDPYLAAIASVEETKAIQELGVIVHIKHFIFNDVESDRNGIGIWFNEQSAREIYLLPWEYSLRPSMGNAHAIMSSFNRVGCVWASASSELITNILRTEWGFDGYILTDMASSNAGFYMTYDDGFMNGTDCFLGTGSTDALDEWKTSPAFCTNIREATHRMLYIFVNYSAAMNGLSSGTKVVSVLTYWQIILVVLLVLSAVGFAGSVTMLVLSYRKNKNIKIIH